MAERRGLLIDFGGVLTSDLFESFASFCRAEGIDPDGIARLFREPGEGQDLLVGLEEGTSAEKDFERRLAPLVGVAESDGLIGRLMAEARPDREMLDAVRAFHDAGVPTGLVSNSWGTSRYDPAVLDELFDGVVLSGEVGIRKPSRRIYELGAEAIGIPPAECVFVDDLGFNLKPAAALGMATVRHTSAAATIPELERLLGVAV